MSSNDKYGSSLDRPYGAGKPPVDPATRLSELLAQSLDELTRPFDAPRPGGHPAQQVSPQEPMPAPPSVAPAQMVTAAPRPQPVPPPQQPSPPANPEQGRIDADKALAELEAELFAAAKQVDRDASIPHAKNDGGDHDDHAANDDHKNIEVREPTSSSDMPDKHFDQLERALMEPLVLDLDAKADADKSTEKKDGDKTEAGAIVAPSIAPEAHAEPVAEADASALVARVRRLMLISMAVTVIAVGSVFGFIGYRVMKGEGASAKIADKLPPASAIPTDVTLSIPRGAKVLQSAVTNDRLVMTLEIDGKVEVRTFDVKTLQPAGRLNFSATP